MATTASTTLETPTTAFAVGTFTILAYAVICTKKFQYNAVVALRHPEEVAFVELQHRKTSFRRRESMHTAVFAKWGSWRREEGSEGREGRKIKVIGQEGTKEG